MVRAADEGLLDTGRNMPADSHQSRAIFASDTFVTKQLPSQGATTLQQATFGNGKYKSPVLSTVNLKLLFETTTNLCACGSHTLP